MKKSYTQIISIVGTLLFLFVSILLSYFLVSGRIDFNYQEKAGQKKSVYFTESFLHDNTVFFKVDVSNTGTDGFVYKKMFSYLSSEVSAKPVPCERACPADKVLNDNCECVDVKPLGVCYGDDDCKDGLCIDDTCVTTSTYAKCSTDNDCIKGYIGCCDCSNGGQNVEIAMNKTYWQKYRDTKTHFCKNVVCKNVYMCQYSPDDIRCNAGICELHHTKRTPICGDGIVDSNVGEECDDGNVTDGDGCSSACKIEKTEEYTDVNYVKFTFMRFSSGNWVKQSSKIVPALTARQQFTTFGSLSDGVLYKAMIEGCHDDACRYITTQPTYSRIFIGTKPTVKLDYNFPSSSACSNRSVNLVLNVDPLDCNVNECPFSNANDYNVRWIRLVLKTGSTIITTKDLDLFTQHSLNIPFNSDTLKAEVYACTNSSFSTCTKRFLSQDLNVPKCSNPYVDVAITHFIVPSGSVYVNNPFRAFYTVRVEQRDISYRDIKLNFVVRDLRDRKIVWTGSKTVAKPSSSIWTSDAYIDIPGVSHVGMYRIEMNVEIEPDNSIDANPSNNHGTVSIWASSRPPSCNKTCNTGEYLTDDCRCVECIYDTQCLGLKTCSANNTCECNVSCSAGKVPNAECSACVCENTCQNGYVQLANCSCVEEGSNQSNSDANSSGSSSSVSQDEETTQSSSVIIVSPEQGEEFGPTDKILLQFEIQDDKTYEEDKFEWFIDGNSVGTGNNVSVSIEDVGSHDLTLFYDGQLLNSTTFYIIDTSLADTDLNQSSATNDVSWFNKIPLVWFFVGVGLLVVIFVAVVIAVIRGS